MYQRDTVSFLVWSKACEPSAQVSTSYRVMFNAHCPWERFISSKIGVRINLCPCGAVLIILASTWDPYQTWLVTLNWEEYGPLVFRRGSIGLNSELFAEKAMRREVTLFAVFGAVVCASTLCTLDSRACVTHHATIFRFEIVERAIFWFCNWGNSFTFFGIVVSKSFSIRQNSKV
jgi:hypothetical protein